MSDFYERLSYSFGNEDWSTEHKALSIQPDDRVLCITASGDRPLHLAMAECKEIVSLDLNTIQSHLLELKMAALKSLNYKEFLQLLGAEHHGRREALFMECLKELSPEAQAYWNKNLCKIKRGVLYEGTMEKLLKKLARALRFFRRKKLDQLFNIHDLEEQKKFINEKWNTYLWKKLLHIGCHPSLTKFFIKDPGLNEFAYKTCHIGSYVLDRMHNCLHTTLARDNFFISLLLRGTVDPHMFPPYLREEGVSKIKGQLDKIKVHSENVIEYLKRSPDNSFDCFSFSDIASYMSKEDFLSLLREMQRTSRPGARFCMRQFLTFHDFPKESEEILNREYELEKILENEDKCFVYRFMVGKVNK